MNSAYNAYLDWVASRSPEAFWTVVRPASLFLLYILGCNFVFEFLRERAPRVVIIASLWAAIIAATLFVMGLPLERLHLGRTARGWVFVFALFALVWCPIGVSWFLVPRAGLRHKFLITTWAVLAVTVLAGIWRSS